MIRLPFVVLAAAALSACAVSSEDEGRLLVTSGFTDQLFVLDVRDGSILDSLDLDRRPGERDEPHGVSVSADGDHFYVTLAHGEPSVWKFERAGLRPVGRLTLEARGASRIRLSPDGSVAAIPDYWLSGGGRLSGITFVRTDDLSVIREVEVCAAPHDAAFAPGGGSIAVACPLSDEWVVLDGADHSVVRTITVPGDPAGQPRRPLNVAWLDDETFFAGVHRNGGTYRVHAPTGRVELVSPSGGPAQLAVSPDRSSVVTANRADGSLTIHTVGEGSRTVPLPGANPHGVAFAEGSGTVYVTYEGSPETAGGVHAVDLRTGTVTWSREVGVYTLGIAWLPPGG